MSFRERFDPGQGTGSPRYPGSFLLAFRESAERLGWKLERLIQDVAQCVDGAGREHLVGVENLYRRARRTPREQWHELIADFLQTVSSAEDADHLPADLASVADRLLLRLGQPLKLENEEARVWAQEVSGTGLVMNLVIDFPNRMCYVTDELVAKSSKPGSDWIDQARTNLLARTPEDCFPVVHEESGMRICNVADAYDSSRVVLLDTLLPETRVNGYLVVLPGRDELLVLPITLQAIPHMHLLKVVAEKNFHNAPYPISDEVYWVRAGAWKHVPIEIKANEITVTPPEELIDVLNGLTEDQPDTESESDDQEHEAPEA